ncbi:MAG: PstS family phosphate ABC transporter substrate-binding protein [Chloroflexi bacterium]|nr:PstS family phosphate ABC transporter substrate-binding protein [Chloroflexota bacterium]
MSPHPRWPPLALIAPAAARAAAACGGGGDDAAGPSGAQPGQAPRLSGTIEIAGSSTVFPIAEAWAEEFGLATDGVHVNVASIGSGAGFERFCNGETDITNASRAMHASEEEICDANGVAFIEIPVAADGLTVVVNVNNDWVDYLTLDELAKIFGPADFAVTWADVRPGWPDTRISIFSPGSDSGTFDYFSDEVNGEEGVQRTDNTQFSEDDNVLVQGINGELGAVGYFGFAYFINNQKRVRAVPIDPGTGAVSPTIETIENGAYAPLSRPLFIYAKVESLERRTVRAFLEWALTTGRILVDDPSVGYVQLPDALYAASLARVEDGSATGALMAHAPEGATLADIFVE